MTFDDASPSSRMPTGLQVAPMSYAKLEAVAEEFRPLLPLERGTKYKLDAGRILERTLAAAKYNYVVEDESELKQCAAFTVNDLVVLRRDVYDGIYTDDVFSRSTVIHEFSHIGLQHAAKLFRGAVAGQHAFFEDSEWQAKALTAALMMPLKACHEAENPFALARMCGTSAQAATYRIEQVTKAGHLGAEKKKALEAQKHSRALR